MKARVWSKSGFSLVEILIAMSILTLCMLPVFNLVQSSRVQTSFSDYHIFSHIRATRLLDIFASYPFEQLILLDQSAQKGNLVAMGADTPALPPKLASRLAPDGFRERFYFTVLEKGLGCLEVEIRWKFPAPDQDWREVSLQRFVSKKNLSLLADEGL
jgi:prepilin-type N-terminal cleavage/methylation domain-containing protein